MSKKLQEIVRFCLDFMVFLIICKKMLEIARNWKKLSGMVRICKNVKYYVGICMNI